MTTDAPPIRERQANTWPAEARWLSYAAAPAFAVMAVVTGVPTGAMPVTCLGGPETFLGGMAWMYVMMSVVHLPPWLRLLSRHDAADRPA